MMFLIGILLFFSLSRVFLFTLWGVVSGLIATVLLCYLFLIAFSLFDQFHLQNQRGFDAQYRVAPLNEVFLHEDEILNHFFIRTKPFTISQSQV